MPILHTCVQYDSANCNNSTPMRKFLLEKAGTSRNYSIFTSLHAVGHFVSDINNHGTAIDVECREECAKE